MKNRKETMLVDETFITLAILRSSRILLSSKHRINPDPEQIDKIKSGNKVLESKVRLRLTSAITQQVFVSVQCLLTCL